MRAFLKVFLAIGLTLFLAIIACLFTILFGFRLLHLITIDTDEEMIRFFEINSGYFNSLAERLMAEDELRVIFPDSHQCQLDEQEMISVANHKRCKELVEEFERLDLRWAYTGSEPLRLTTAVSGLGVSGSSKGYYYSSEPPPNLVRNTDEEVDPTTSPEVFRHI